LYILGRKRQEEVKSTLIHIKWYESKKSVCIFQAEGEDRALETLKRLFAGRQATIEKTVRETVGG
jgi:RNA binding exosome subunit